MVNSPVCSTISSVYGAVALLLGGGAIPVNDGLYRPIDVHVPFGSFLNPDQPLAMRARANACHRVYNAVMLAMSKAAPEQVLTSGHDTTNAIGMGHLGKDGYRVYMEVVGGGWGGLGRGGRSRRRRQLHRKLLQRAGGGSREGLSVHGGRGVLAPRGSSGAGTRRGGLGARRVYRILEDDVSFNCYSDRFRIAPWGLFGGRPGEKTRFLVEREGGNDRARVQGQLPFPERRPPRHRDRGRRGLRRAAEACERGRGARPLGRPHHRGRGKGSVRARARRVDLRPGITATRI